MRDKPTGYERLMSALAEVGADTTAHVSTLPGGYPDEELWQVTVRDDTGWPVATVEVRPEEPNDIWVGMEQGFDDAALAILRKLGWSDEYARRIVWELYDEEDRPHVGWRPEDA